MKYFLLLIFATLLNAHKIQAQNPNSLDFNKSIAFAEYLHSTHRFQDLDLYYRNMLAQNRWSMAQIDTIYWGMGISYYAQKQLDSAAIYLEKVQNTAPELRTKALFFASISRAHKAEHKQAQADLQYTGQDSLLLSLQSFERAGVALLQRDYAAYAKEHKADSVPYYAINEQYTNLDKYKSQLKAVKKKSPLAAGIMSAILPGSGKFYAGKKGQGIATFLQNAVLGVQTYESYKKAGVKSARFIIYGGLFTVFYLGNIWGSSLSVKIKQQEMYDHIDNQILFDMHIPLRTVFNY
jgi:hypothetical protein